ncbi:class I adenylate-forming enzyme family protein [Terrarubrum flagellatum]|uniref:class I adenylate-forming enzyme family protein n=1 Tax=Terrirubrum flagellatum TaxID=2895980 RepID=UPI003145437F
MLISETTSRGATPDWLAQGWWTNEPLWTSLERAAAGPGRASFIADEAEEIPVSELLARARSAAGAFTAACLRRGDAIVIQSRNRIDAFAAMLGCFAGGYLAVPLPPIFSARQVAAAARASAARGFVLFDGDGLARVAEICAEAKETSVVFAPDAACDAPLMRPWSEAQRASQAAPTPFAAAEPAFALFSSGSLGEPKGVVHSANTLRYASLAVARRHGVGAQDVVLAALEFGFVGGLVLNVLLALLTGASIVLMRKWDPEEALALIARRRATYSLFMPTHCHDLLKSPSLAATDTRSLTRAVMAGINRDARIEAEKTFCVRPLAMFGMSESIGHATPSPDDPDEARWTTDGKVLDGAEELILSPSGEPARADEPGDLLVRGPNRFLSYLGRPDLTANVLTADGWFRTGDRAVVDRQGFLTFIGREKDIIRRGGVTILPGDVENALIGHPEIAEVSVVAVPDERLGERTCACIVTRGGSTPDVAALAAYLEAQNVARYLWPEHALAFEALPRTVSLKVRRADLRDEAIRRLRDSGALAPAA